MKTILRFLIFSSHIFMGAQDIDKPETNLSKEESVEVLKWYLEITEKGIEKIGDSVIYSKEFIKVLNNEEYRSFIFPKEYNREVAAYLINNKNLKQAFWYLINIFPQNEDTKKIVIQSVIAYD